MSSGADSASVASPCTSVCIIDPVTGLCGGCFRTLEEISGWIDFSATEKRTVITRDPSGFFWTEAPMLVVWKAALSTETPPVPVELRPV